MSRFAELLDAFFYRPDEDPGPELERIAPPIETVAPALIEEEQEHLAFMLGSECYALSLHALREIVRVPPLTEVPRSQPELLGVMNLRGEVIPVYDLELRLGLTSKPARVAGPEANLEALPKGTRVLVVKSDAGAAGILVSSVAGVVRLRPSAIEEPPRGVASRRGDWMLGLGRKDDRLYILIDVEQALG